MVDLPHIKTSYGHFLTVPEYLKLYSDPSMNVSERWDGKWSYDHSNLSLHTVERSKFFPQNSLLVDNLNPIYEPLEERVARTNVPFEFNSTIILTSLYGHFGDMSQR